MPAMIEREETLRAPAYVIRPPGTPHGLLISAIGCLLLEIQACSDWGAPAKRTCDRPQHAVGAGEYQTLVDGAARLTVARPRTRTAG